MVGGEASNVMGRFGSGKRGHVPSEPSNYRRILLANKLDHLFSPFENSRGEAKCPRTSCATGSNGWGLGIRGAWSSELRNEVTTYTEGFWPELEASPGEAGWRSAQEA